MTKKKDELWIEAKKRCRLNEEDIQLAKQLGMSPKSLLKNIPNKTQTWKVPVKVWIRDLAEAKNIKIMPKNPKVTPSTKIQKEETKYGIDEEDLPF